MTLLQFPKERLAGRSRSTSRKKVPETTLIHPEKHYPRGFGLGDPASIMAPVSTTLIGTTLVIFAWMAVIALSG